MLQMEQLSISQKHVIRTSSDHENRVRMTTRSSGVNYV